jgi:hypothetical protein
MTSLELVAPITHDTWRGRALPTELHPQICEPKNRPVPKLVSQQVVKERPPPPSGVGGAIHRSLVCANARTGSNQKWKRPGSFRNPGLCVQRVEGARLSAALSRMHSVLIPIKLPAAKRLVESAAHRGDLMQGDVACALRLRCRRPERDQTLYGSVGSDGVPGFHDEALGENCVR